jgi:hypothetical protein
MALPPGDAPGKAGRIQPLTAESRDGANFNCSFLWRRVDEKLKTRAARFMLLLPRLN